MTKMTKVAAIKEYMTRKDNISPDGGKPVTVAELRALGGLGLAELGQLCAAELGVELEAPKSKAA